MYITLALMARFGHNMYNCKLYVNNKESETYTIGSAYNPAHIGARNKNSTGFHHGRLPLLDYKGQFI